MLAAGQDLLGEATSNEHRSPEKHQRRPTLQQEAAVREFVIKEEMQPCWSLILATDVGRWLGGSYRDICTVNTQQRRSPGLRAKGIVPARRMKWTDWLRRPCTDVAWSQVLCIVGATIVWLAFYAGEPSPLFQASGVS